MLTTKRNFNKPELGDPADITKVSANFDLDELNLDGICGTAWGGYVSSDTDIVELSKVYIDTRNNTQYVTKTAGAWSSVIKEGLSLDTLNLGKVNKTTKVNTGVGLSGGGDLSADRTISLVPATSTVIGGTKPDNSTMQVGANGIISMKDAWRIRAKAIGSSTVNTDLNTVLEKGFYKSNVGNNLFTNRPVGADSGAFYLEVKGIQEDFQYGTQTFYNFTNNRIFHRVRSSPDSSSSNWTAWTELATVENSVQKTQLATATTTGIVKGGGNISIDGTGKIDVKPATSSVIGGVKPRFDMLISADGTIGNIVSNVIATNNSYTATYGFLIDTLVPFSSTARLVVRLKGFISSPINGAIRINTTADAIQVFSGGGQWGGITTGKIKVFNNGEKIQLWIDGADNLLSATHLQVEVQSNVPLTANPTLSNSTMPSGVTMIVTPTLVSLLDKEAGDSTYLKKGGDTSTGNQLISNTLSSAGHSVINPNYCFYDLKRSLNDTTYFRLGRNASQSFLTLYRPEGVINPISINDSTGAVAYAGGSFNGAISSSSSIFSSVSTGQESSVGCKLTSSSDQFFMCNKGIAHGLYSVVPGKTNISIFERLKSTGLTNSNFDTNKGNPISVLPVGSVLLFEDKNINPATLYVGTTWQRIADNRNIRGCTATDNGGLIGGSDTATITQANLPSVTLSSGAHTHDKGNMNITGNVYSPAGGGAFHSSGATDTSCDYSSGGRFNNIQFNASRTWTGTVGSTGNIPVPLGGSNTPLNIVNPYYKLHIWKRLT